MTRLQRLTILYLKANKTRRSLTETSRSYSRCFNRHQNLPTPSFPKESLERMARLVITIRGPPQAEIAQALYG